MRVRIEIGPVTILDLTLFEPTAEPAEPDVIVIHERDGLADEDDNDLRGGL